jgi:hypothetical protein
MLIRFFNGNIYIYIKRIIKKRPTKTGSIRSTEARKKSEKREKEKINNSQKITPNKNG